MIVSEAIGCSHVWKRFGPVVANRDVSLSVARGEVHAVVGENGAGKSTLMNALYGLHPPDQGEVRIDGQVVARPSASESIRRGVGMVHQHFMLVPTLTVTENVVLGREPRRGLLLDLGRAGRELSELAERYGIGLEPHRLVGELTVGEAQRVEIIKVLWRGASVLILDEPTAVLTPLEVDRLFAVLTQLVGSGKTVVLVTHKLDEVMRLHGRISVMRRGAKVAELDAARTSAAEIARAMVGREVALGRTRARRAVAGKPRLEVEQLSVASDSRRAALEQVDLTVRGGEIVGVAGVEGNGQTELGLAVAGLLAPTTGRIRLDGADATSLGVRARQARGLGHVPEDRQGRGLILSFSVADNVMLGREPVYARRLSIDRRRLEADTARLLARLDVRPADPGARVAWLSGGNQQKLVVGRELERRPGVLVCAQPTRGVDVGAIERIHAELEAARDAGCAMLLFSAELDELLDLADRIVVLYRGRVVGALENDPARRAELKAQLGDWMLGVRREAPSD